VGLDVTRHEPGAGAPHRDAHPAFYFDLASPEAYLSAERILQLMPIATEWIPVLARDLPGGAPPADREAVAKVAAARGMQGLRWPEPFPFDSQLGMLAATYARQIGRTVAFTLAAFRQAYAAGRAMSEPDNVVIAGSACEMHPSALLKGCELRGTRHALAAQTRLAAERGVRSVPAVWVPAATRGAPGQVFHGDEGLERAAALMAAAA
jgi:2-hydroxychromene-2-carboxylate isomerase